MRPNPARKFQITSPRSRGQVVLGRGQKNPSRRSGHESFAASATVQAALRPRRPTCAASAKRRLHSGDREVEPHPQGADQFSEDLIAVRPSRGLEKIMESFLTCSRDRGFLMLRNEVSGNCAMWSSTGTPPDPPKTPSSRSSKTIARTACSKIVCILTPDAWSTALGAGDSIRFHEIRSAMWRSAVEQGSGDRHVHVDSPM